MHGFNQYMSRCVLFDNSFETQQKALTLIKRMVTLMRAHDHVELERFYGKNCEPFTTEIMRRSNIVLKMARRLHVELDESDCMSIYLKERAKELGVDAEAVMARHKKTKNAINEVVVLCAFVEVARKYMDAIWESSLDWIDQEPIHTHPDHTFTRGGRRRFDELTARELSGAHAPRPPKFAPVRPTFCSLMPVEDVKVTPKPRFGSMRRLLHPYSRSRPDTALAFAATETRKFPISASLQALQRYVMHDDIENIPSGPAPLLAY
ncbi:hypothetical protein FRC09_020697 [Ceratobasidium sp. 395]|nr:hypothetical protein FRC09_020697 [Ceratobasidium sp. 395]